MVQLTRVLSKHIPVWMDYFERKVFLRKQAIYRLTYAMKGRYRNCYKRASINLYVQYRKEQEQRAKDRKNMRHLNSARIHAACEDLDYSFSKFTYKLPLLGVELDRKSLANLAIWEPRSFEALVEIAKKYEVQSFENKLK